VVGDHQRVIAGSFVRGDQAQRELLKDVLFVGGGLRAAGGFGLGHARERKRVGGGCFAESVKPFSRILVLSNKRASWQKRLPNSFYLPRKVISL
jgi:hypothetical protein